ncbi:hypothetical protein BGX34_003799 [Mortierella sp. NVP85]|nr:hypothetical protein BGX34_003799 [Mortierella sp. NVP85]
MSSKPSASSASQAQPSIESSDTITSSFCSCLPFLRKSPKSSASSPSPPQVQTRIESSDTTSNFTSCFPFFRKTSRSSVSPPQSPIELTPTYVAEVVRNGHPHNRQGPLDRNGQIQGSAQDHHVN